MNRVSDRSARMIECPKPVREARRGDTLARVVADYIRYCRPRARAERMHFAGLASLREAVRLAGLAQTREGKRFSHQRRIPSKTLRRAGDELHTALRRIAACRDFDTLYDIVLTTAGRVRGIGALAVYDTANRIGGKLGLEPTRVFLHAGTREGAKALGLPTRDGVVEASALPAELRSLRPREVEDALCIFKRRLKRIAATRTT